MAISLEELESIRSTEKRPADFDAFWREQLEILASVPMDWERTPDPILSTETRPVDTLKFRSVDGMWIYAWLASGQREHCRSAALLYLPGYSYGNPHPSSDTIYDGVITVCLNLHGNTPETPYMHPRVVGGDYVLDGIDSPSTYIYRRIILHGLRALEVLAVQPDVDPNRIAVGGMSQGGGLSLVSAALSKIPQLCLADMPWLGDLDRALSLIDPARYKPGVPIPDGRAYIRQYAEAHPEKAEQIYQTYRYIDPLSHAGNIQVPVQCSAGGKDPSCRPQTVFSVYNEINTEKEMLYLPDTGHEIIPAMREAHDRWLQERLV